MIVTKTQKQQHHLLIQKNVTDYTALLIKDSFHRTDGKNFDVLSRHNQFSTKTLFRVRPVIVTNLEKQLIQKS